MKTVHLTQFYTAQGYSHGRTLYTAGRGWWINHAGEYTRPGRPYTYAVVGVPWINHAGDVQI